MHAFFKSGKHEILMKCERNMKFVKLPPIRILHKKANVSSERDGSDYPRIFLVCLKKTFPNHVLEIMEILKKHDEIIYDPFVFVHVDHEFQGLFALVKVIHVDSLEICFKKDHKKIYR